MTAFHSRNQDKFGKDYSPTPDTYVHAFYYNSEAFLQRVVSNYPFVDKTGVI